MLQNVLNLFNLNLMFMYFVGSVVLCMSLMFLFTRALNNIRAHKSRFTVNVIATLGCACYVIAIALFIYSIYVFGFKVALVTSVIYFAISFYPAKRITKYVEKTLLAKYCNV